MPGAVTITARKCVCFYFWSSRYRSPGCAPVGISVRCPPSSTSGKAHFHFLREQKLVTSRRQPGQGKPEEPQEGQPSLLFAIIPDGFSADLEVAGWDHVILELVAPRPSVGKGGALQSSGKQGLSVLRSLSLQGGATRMGLSIQREEDSARAAKWSDLFWLTQSLSHNPDTTMMPSHKHLLPSIPPKPLLQIPPSSVPGFTPCGHTLVSCGCSPRPTTGP